MTICWFGMQVEAAAASWSEAVTANTNTLLEEQRVLNDHKAQLQAVVRHLGTWPCMAVCIVYIVILRCNKAMLTYERMGVMYALTCCG